MKSITAISTPSGEHVTIPCSMTICGGLVPNPNSAFRYIFTLTDARRIVRNFGYRITAVLPAPRKPSQVLR